MNGSWREKNDEKVWKTTSGKCVEAVGRHYWREVKAWIIREASERQIFVRIAVAMCVGEKKCEKVCGIIHNFHATIAGSEAGI